MKPIQHIRFLSSCALLGICLSSPARAQYYDMPAPTPVYVENRPSQRPMPMLRNELRQEQRRQGAKCMNAYPEDHSGFTNCIRNENQSNRTFPARMHYMPMRDAPNE